MEHDGDVIEAELTDHEHRVGGEVAARPVADVHRAAAEHFSDQRERDIYGEQGHARNQEHARRAENRRRLLVPANTTAAYAQGVAAWNRFAEAEDLPASTAAWPKQATLALYVDWLLDHGRILPGRNGTTGYSAETASSLLSGAIHGLTESGRAVGYRPETKPAWKHLAQRTAATPDGDDEVKPVAPGRGQAKAISEAAMREAFEQLDATTVTGRRDRAILAVGWCVFARSVELAGMRVRDIQLGEMDGSVTLGVHIRTGKTRLSVRDVLLEPWTHPVERLAIEAWAAYRHDLAAAGPAPDSHAFRGLYRGTGLTRSGISSETISNVVEAACGTTQHGIRAGAATAYYADGMEREELARRGGWTVNSAEMAKYIRQADILTRMRASRAAAQQTGTDQNQ
ncbi:hypothetical protein ACIGZJ_30715 [Kitasatospora sp. NPDC052868]|uniref:hypothetical protein n=1 Tax=Kitasatospora sp. NPDC052868 TaxID=3364060 RepID=UPI0037C909D1